MGCLGKQCDKSLRNFTVWLWPSSSIFLRIRLMRQLKGLPFLHQRKSSLNSVIKMAEQVIKTKEVFEVTIKDVRIYKDWNFKHFASVLIIDFDVLPAWPVIKDKSCLRDKVYIKLSSFNAW